MTKLKNSDGTYNVYDFTKGDNGSWIEVTADSLAGVDLTDCVELEIHGSTKGKELKVIKYNSYVCYQNIFGNWGFPYVVD